MVTTWCEKSKNVWWYTQSNFLKQRLFKVLCFSGPFKLFFSYAFSHVYTQALLLTRWDRICQRFRAKFEVWNKEKTTAGVYNEHLPVEVSSITSARLVTDLKPYFAMLPWANVNYPGDVKNAFHPSWSSQFAHGAFGINLYSIEIKLFFRVWLPFEKPLCCNSSWNRLRWT